MKLRIRSKLIVIFLIFFTVPMLIASFFFFYYAKSFAREKSLDLNVQNINYVGAAVDVIFNYIYNYSLYPPFDDSIVSYLTADLEDETYHNRKKNARDAIILLPYANSNIQGVRIWRMDGGSIQSGKEISMTEEQRALLLQTKGASIWTHEGREIYLSRLLKKPLALWQNIGFLKIRLDSQALSHVFSEKNENEGVYFLMDEGGEIFYASGELTPKAEKLVEGLAPEILTERTDTSWYEAEGGCYVTPHLIGDTGWLLFGISGDSFSMNLSSYLGRVFFLFALVCIPACILLAVVFSAVVLSPLKKMGSLMQQIEKENFSVHLDVRSNDELAVLAKQFNHMSDELADLYNRVYLGNMRLKDAQLAALWAQINPHFLYNTLDTIYWMSEFHGTEDVSSMISALSRLFRLSLSGDQNDRIPLSAELEHVKCFLYIEKIRYGDELDYSIEVLDEELEGHLKEYKVLKLVLQPIAENAILHGIDQNGSGSVRIVLSTEGGCIRYEISNTGSADIESIEKILETENSREGSIGLNNIQQRIRLKYGNRYGIRCFNRGGETVFQVRLPKEEL